MNQTKKPRDEAQRWRAFRNISRFFKNPFGYTYWKLDPLHKQNRIRVTWGIVIFHLYSSFVLYLVTKKKKEGMIEHWRYRIGETDKTHSLANRDRRMPANRHKNYIRYSNFHQVRRNKRLNMIHLNWWCRDQNFRKYFEMRKKNDLRPSETGFAHEAIKAETDAKNAEIAAMRASRASR